MINISNKSTDELNTLIVKYKSVLEQVYESETIPYLAVVLDIAVPYINNNYSELNSDVKSWSIYVLKILLREIKDEVHIRKIIDEFLQYYETKHKNYGNDIVLSASLFDKDMKFAYDYAVEIKSKN